MDQYEYEITRHKTESSGSVVYFCSESGECGIESVGQKHTAVVTGILNERGALGWELVQLVFGKNGFMAFWKRRRAIPQE